MSSMKYEDNRNLYPQIDGDGRNSRSSSSKHKSSRNSSHNGLIKHDSHDKHRNNKRIKEEKFEPDEKHRFKKYEDWSEQISKAGKKYYYNCRTEVSQWEKPPDWIEFEKKHYYMLKHGGTNLSTSSEVRAQANGHELNVVPSTSNADYGRGYGQQSSQKPHNRTDHQPTTITVNQAHHHPHHIQSTSSSNNNNDRNSKNNNHSASTNMHLETISTTNESEKSTTAVASSSRVEVSATCRNAMRQQEAADSNSTYFDLPALPTFSSSHASFYRDQMSCNIKDWAASHFENQALSLSERSFQTSLEVAQVSADLKCSRSLVRTAEIRATLLDQRYITTSYKRPYRLLSQF
uniref:WW domain-containing protein n=1 Tax=Romanomermis culicivorax TaxID=13658 RepID=A0A915JGF5_ROMCU